MNEKHFCSCCLSEECYKDMSNDYYYGEITENYSEMLLNIFNINILNIDGQRSLICEECVSKLRDAAAYKKKILEVQEILKKSLISDNNGSNIDANLADPDNFEDFNEIDDSINENDIKWENFTSETSQKDKFFIIKLGSNKQKSPASTKTYSIFNSRHYKKENKHQECYTNSSLEQTGDKNSTMLHKVYKVYKRNKKSIKIGLSSQDSAKTSHDPIENDENASEFYISEGNDGLYAKPLSSDEDDKDFNIAENSKSIKRKGVKKNVDTAGRIKKKVERRREISQIELRLSYKRENTLKLIQNSNLCLFRSFQNKFGCQFCYMKFNEISQLKEHSVSHVSPKIASQVNRLRGMSYKNAEISNLKCNLCSENYNDLPQLMDHLKIEHKIAFQGTEHYLVPYKLHDGFKCTLCELKFKTYLRLSIHMNSHYTNNVCEMCGLSFINRQSLISHVQSQHKEKKCSQCPAIFLTSAAKTKHLRQAHGVRNLKSYCNMCNKTFRYSYMVNEHKIKDHGLERETFSCTQCEKSFWSSVNLKLHVRSVHIKERNYPCTKCGMRFFTKCDQHRHERTHEDLRSFSCSYCEAKFKSKDSWRRHLKRQHGHVFEKDAANS